MSEIVTLHELGTTQMLVRTDRIAQATGIEVTSPESQTEVELRMTGRRVDVQIFGGAPGADGEDGEDSSTDPGDLVPILNALLNQGI